MSLIERAIAKLAATNPQATSSAPRHAPKLEPRLEPRLAPKREQTLEQTLEQKAEQSAKPLLRAGHLPDPWPSKSTRPTVRLVPKSAPPVVADEAELIRQIEKIESVDEAETLMPETLMTENLMAETLMAETVVAQTLIDERPARSSAAPQLGKRVAIAPDVLRAQGFITLERARTRVAHQFRVIKRILIDNALQRSGETRKHPRRIMITSALPGEGKTFCSINLAITLAAERNLRVLLVDADFARPGVMNALGLQAGPGLTDWLKSDNESPAHLILPTNIRGLSLMAAGSPIRNTTELLSSGRTARRLRQLEAMLRNYIVLFDTSPLLPTIESLALSRHMGQVILVVEADVTPRQAVGEACAMLSDHPSVALLLNKQKFKDGSENYGYGKYKRESR